MACERFSGRQTDCVDDPALRVPASKRLPEYRGTFLKPPGYLSVCVTYDCLVPPGMTDCQYYFVPASLCSDLPSVGASPRTAELAAYQFKTNEGAVAKDFGNLVPGSKPGSRSMCISVCSTDPIFYANVFWPLAARVLLAGILAEGARATDRRTLPTSALAHSSPYLAHLIDARALSAAPIPHFDVDLFISYSCVPPENKKLMFEQ